MSINIKNHEAERLLAEIKSATGLGTSRIVLDLLRGEAARLRRRRDLAKRKKKIALLAKRFRARLSGPDADRDALVGYDEHGLPI